jgi:hypothetical protein
MRSVDCGGCACNRELIMSSNHGRLLLLLRRRPTAVQWT